jgi:hypothetical protein
MQCMSNIFQLLPWLRHLVVKLAYDRLVVL